MEILIKYWSQFALLLGLIGFILKTIFDYKIKNKELRNKFFYELKAQRVIDLYKSIVEIQMILDRSSGEEMRRKIFSKRIQLDTFFWESKFYFKKKTQKSFKLFLELMKFYEDETATDYYKNYELDFERTLDILLKNFKKELL